jgi:polysaccharide biosynthesis/export protein
MKKPLFFAAIFLLVFASCKTNNLFMAKKTDNSVEALDSIFYKKGNSQYTIRKDDKISISVWGQDDLSIGSSYGIYNSNEVYGKWLMVDANGNIETPKLGTMRVEGKTIIELKDTLKILYAQWLKNPIVDVKILNREIIVMGEVRDPQVVLVDKERNRLLDVVAKCKGFEMYANLKYIKVLRQVGQHVYVANINLTKSGNHLLKNIDLQPGDILIVPSKGYKEFDRRISIIIPFTTTLTAAAIFMRAF